MCFFTFTLNGSKPIYRYDELEETQAQASLKIFKNGEVFEEYGPYSLKDMTQYGDTFFLVSRHKECIQTKLIQTSDYNGMEFYLELLYGDMAIAEFRGIKDEKEWKDVRVFPE